jgi:hypothetical protein
VRQETGSFFVGKRRQIKPIRVDGARLMVKASMSYRVIHSATTPPLLSLIPIGFFLAPLTVLSP